MPANPDHGTVPAPPHPLTELADWVEQTALQDMYAAVAPALARSAGLFVERISGAVALGAPGLPSVSVNRVFLPVGVSPDVAGSVIERMRKAGVRAYFAHVHAGAPPALIEALGERGLARYHRAWIKLARDRAPLDGAPFDRRHNPEGGAFELRAATREQADVFAELVVRCTGVDPAISELLAGVVQRPRWHVYFALRGGRPVATGALFVQGDVGYLGFGATLPEHRNQGLQRMLLAKRIRVALALGCRVIISETGEAIPGQPNSSYDNLVSLGLAPIAKRDNYTLEGMRWG